MQSINSETLNISIDEPTVLKTVLELKDSNTGQDGILSILLEQLVARL